MLSIGLCAQGRRLGSGPERELPAFLRQLEGQSQPNVAKPTTRDSSSKRRPARRFVGVKYGGLLLQPMLQFEKERQSPADRKDLLCARDERTLGRPCRLLHVPSPTKKETSDCANGSPAFPFRSGSKEVHVMTKWPLPSRRGFRALVPKWRRVCRRALNDFAREKFTGRAEDSRVSAQPRRLQRFYPRWGRFASVRNSEDQRVEGQHAKQR